MTIPPQTYTQIQILEAAVMLLEYWAKRDVALPMGDATFRGGTVDTVNPNHWYSPAFPSPGPQALPKAKLRPNIQQIHDAYLSRLDRVSGKASAPARAERRAVERSQPRVESNMQKVIHRAVSTQVNRTELA